MSIETTIIDPELIGDTQAVVAALTSGKQLDPAIIRRVRARSEAISERILREQGPLDIAVPAIREFRDR